MQGLTVASPKISRFPLVLSISALVFTFITLAMCLVSTIYVDRMINRSLRNAIAASNLYGQIRLLDESLGMAARLAIMTGDSSWEVAYNTYDAELTAAINDAIALLPDDMSDASAKNADLANKKLVRMESDAFQLAKAGKVDDAKKIIFGKEYEQIKKSYVVNVMDYRNELHSALEMDISRVKNTQKIAFIFLLVDFIVLVVAWILTYSKVKLWKLELESKIQSEMQYKKEIESAKHFLQEVLNINKMNDRLQTCQNSTEAYEIIAHTAKELFPNLSGGLVIRHHDSNEMETVQTWGDVQCLKQSFSIDDCWALREGHVYIVNKIKDGIVCQHFNPLPLSGYLCVPLIVQSGVIGILELNAGHDNIILDHQQQLAITFCEVLRLCLRNIFLKESLSEQVIQDPLTGLFNRRYLDATLPVMIRRTIRNSKILCVAMVDIDFFKKINDTYGHDAGDEVLKYIGNYLKTNMRESDTACRFGGEEFVIIMESQIKDAVTRLQKISKDISAARLVVNDKTLPPVTISVGIAEAPTHAHNADEMLRLADEALYKAKSSGRNRIEIATV